ncbi:MULTISPECIES: hypothetical protein [Streptosporangium]|uniref:Leucine rich repeat variant n=1 Tax=Streptosporangium brasiliense TaxID=47480 RepID=A0ABT9R085_9ACTN|nr:hypothetical protein [Streptosporangium brasiliense]MDP9862647.1 hypothetical protein [Streptosporangium brasiliense]
MSTLSGLAVNPALPASLMLRMLQPEVTADALPYLAWRADLPERVVEAFIGHHDAKVRECFAGNPHVPAGIRSRLAGDPVLRVRRALAEDPQWHRFQPRTMPLTDAAYDLLAHDPCIEIRCEPAQNRQTPARILTTLAADPEAEVRRTVCSGWNLLPAPVRAALLDDKDPSVRRAAELKGYRERPGLLDKILVSDDATHVVGEAPLPRAMAERCARSSDAERRHLVAENPHLDRDLVEELSTDPDPRIRLRVSLRAELTEAERAAIAYDPELYRVPVTRMPALLDDSDEQVAFSAATNPALPVEAMARLVQTADNMDE